MPSVEIEPSVSPTDTDMDTVEAADLVECSSCHDDCEADDVRQIEGAPYCPSCVYTCEGCDDILPCDAGGGNTASGGTVCHGCIDGGDWVYVERSEEYSPSGDCVYLQDVEEWEERRHAERSCYYSDSQGDWYREPPEPDESETGPLDYDANVLHHCDADRAAMARGDELAGVELEMEARQGESPESLVEALSGPVASWYICKSDGSLTGPHGGVEVVTVPLTLKQHQEAGRWEAITGAVRRLAVSGAGTENCGIHVHVNRKGITPLTIGKLQVFLNDPRNTALMRCIAQRDASGACERSFKKIGDGAKLSHNRYEMLNVNRKGTLEFRIFRGNLRPERIRKNVEASLAFVDFCRQTSIQSLTADAFRTWVRGQRRTYPNLVAYLVERGEVAAHGKGKP